MECPVPKWFRRKFVRECRVMQTGYNDEDLKKAAFTFIERHFKLGVPFGAFSIEYPNVEREGRRIGSYRITVERSDILSVRI
jgi:hypothetical protein